MCGFAGIHELNGGRLEDGIDRLIDRMSSRLSARGPDDHGIHREPSLAIAHRRLAIIDPRPDSKQPMVDSANGAVIALNGEIYNFKELRIDLENRGRVFRTLSDTEVLLQGLVADGLAFLERVNGDFAFAFWSPERQELILARDRFGVKPLYYHLGARRLVFSSEVKPILESGVSVEIDPEALESYLALRYSRGQKSFFKGIEKVPPASALVFSRNATAPKRVRYWQLAPNGAPRKIPYEEAHHGTLERLGASVKRRLVGDVEVGGFLSGGIDSSSIAALARKEGARYPAFSYRFPGELDESGQAEELASALDFPVTRIEHRDRDFTLTSDAVYHCEEPLGDSILVPNLRLFREASKKRVKVALSGEGADEVFGGYAHQAVIGRLSPLLSHAPSWIARGIARGAARAAEAAPLALLEALSPYPTRLDASVKNRVARLLRGSTSIADQHLALSELFRESERDEILPGATGSVAEFNRSYWKERLESYRGFGSYKKLLLFDIELWLADYGLIRTDRLSMSQGLEVRVPFLDHELVEWVFSLPERYLLRLGDRKRLLRDAVRPILPAQNVSRPKNPFFLPAEKAYSPEFLNYAKEKLSRRAVASYGVLNERWIESFLEGLRPAFLDYKKLVSLLHLQEWCEIYLGGKWKDYRPSTG